MKTEFTTEQMLFALATLWANGYTTDSLEKYQVFEDAVMKVVYSPELDTADININLNRAGNAALQLLTKYFEDLLKTTKE